MDTKSLVFVSLTGDVLMTLKDDIKSKEIKWSSILEKIATEEWYQSCEKWRFAFGIKNLEPNDVLVLDDKLNEIICVKIVVPQIIFESPDGKFLVSIPFDKCRTPNTKHAYLSNVCYEDEVYKKLLEFGKDSYGTDTVRIYPYPLDLAYRYIFHDKNGKELELNDFIEDPGNDNVLIVVQLYLHCERSCKIKFYGPLRFGERRKVLTDTISLCSVCGYVHCSSCGMYRHHRVGTSHCRAVRNM
jgi:hypothetical protein